MTDKLIPGRSVREYHVERLENGVWRKSSDKTFDLSTAFAWADRPEGDRRVVCTATDVFVCKTT